MKTNIKKEVNEIVSQYNEKGVKFNRLLITKTYFTYLLAECNIESTKPNIGLVLGTKDSALNVQVMNDPLEYEGEKSQWALVQNVKRDQNRKVVNDPLIRLQSGAVTSMSSTLEQHSSYFEPKLK